MPTSSFKFIRNAYCYFEQTYSLKISQYWVFLAIFLLCGGMLTPAVMAQTPPDDGFTQGLSCQHERVPNVRLPSSATDQNVRLPESETPCVDIDEIVKEYDVTALGWDLPASDVPDDSGVSCLCSARSNLVMRCVQDANLAFGFVATRVFAEARDPRGGILIGTVIPRCVRAIRSASE